VTWQDVANDRQTNRATEKHVAISGSVCAAKKNF